MIFSVVVNIIVLSKLHSFINLSSKLLTETENLTILNSDYFFLLRCREIMVKMWQFLN